MLIHPRAHSCLLLSSQAGKYLWKSLFSLYLEVDRGDNPALLKVIFQHGLLLLLHIFSCAACAVTTFRSTLASPHESGVKETVAHLLQIEVETPAALSIHVTREWSERIVSLEYVSNMLPWYFVLIRVLW